MRGSEDRAGTRQGRGADESAADQHNKADFGSIYVQPDPRAYFRALTPLDYQIPQNALPVVESVLAGMSTPAPTILDVCSSYGINGALLRHDLTLDELARHYTDASGEGASPEQRRAADSAFFEGRLRHARRRVLGLDTSRAAVEYAVGTTLMDAAWAENLEVADPSPQLVAGIRDVDLLLCTGGVGYVGRRTFVRLVSANRDPGRLRVVTFALRMFDYSPIAATLADVGLVTEHRPDLEARQRRFATDAEQQSAVEAVRARGLDPAGKEADGWLVADCYLSGPASTQS